MLTFVDASCSAPRLNTHYRSAPVLLNNDREPVRQNLFLGSRRRKGDAAAALTWGGLQLSGQHTVEQERLGQGGSTQESFGAGILIATLRDRGLAGSNGFTKTS